MQQDTGHAVGLWLIDPSPVKSFSERFGEESGRLDILVENAAFPLQQSWGTQRMVALAYALFLQTLMNTEQHPFRLQVNSLSALLLALLLLPRMLHTAEEYRTTRGFYRANFESDMTNFVLQHYQPKYVFVLLTNCILDRLFLP